MRQKKKSMATIILIFFAAMIFMTTCLISDTVDNFIENNIKNTTLLKTVWTSINKNNTAEESKILYELSKDERICNRQVFLEKFWQIIFPNFSVNICQNFGI
jgi:ABC-type lipoprotein release transport system permease subunit